MSDGDLFLAIRQIKIYYHTVEVIYYLRQTHLGSLAWETTWSLITTVVFIFVTRGDGYSTYKHPLRNSRKRQKKYIPNIIRCFDISKILMMRIIRVLIQNSLKQNKTRRTKTERSLTIEISGKYLTSLLLTSSLFLFWCKEFWINTLIILLIIYILG